MTDEQVLAEFRAAGALLEGHFILSSGLRSSRYLQCARVLMDPARAERLAEALAARLPAEIRDLVQVVVSPAMGGVIIGHEMGARVLLVEDVVTTGLSSREAIAAVTAAGGEVIGAAALVDRSNGSADLGVPFTSLIRLDVPAYQPDALPPELQALPAVKPGSRAAA